MSCRPLRSEAKNPKAADCRKGYGRFNEGAAANKKTRCPARGVHQLANVAVRGKGKKAKDRQTHGSEAATRGIASTKEKARPVDFQKKNGGPAGTRTTECEPRRQIKAPSRGATWQAREKFLKRRLSSLKRGQRKGEAGVFESTGLKGHRGQ